jgi:hypothetical protein
MFVALCDQKFVCLPHCVRCSQRNNGGAMAKKTVFVSDLSGKAIEDDKEAATVTITYKDARRGVVRLDVLASEVEDWAKKGTQQKRRGRKPRPTE